MSGSRKWWILSSLCAVIAAGWWVRHDERATQPPHRPQRAATVVRTRHASGARGAPDTSSRSTASAAGADASTSPAAAPFDVADVIHRVHLAYRSGAEDAFAGGGDTYEVAVAADGSTRVATAPGAEPGTPRESVAELRLAPARLERGGRTIASGAAPRREVAPDGHLAIDHGTHVEHLRNDDGSLEQSWSFATRPEGSGDLRVALDVSGARYVETTETGVHFVRPGGTIGLRYGHATLVDASGARTPVPVTFDSGVLAMNVPGRVLDAARYPVVLDPTITPELGTDVAVPGIDHPAQQRRSSIAWGGTQYLVVWTDARNTGGFQPGIYGTRVTPAGLVVDIGGFVIAATPDSISKTVVASNDPDFLVVWQQDVGGTNTDDIKAARVTAAAVVQDATPITVSAAADVQTSPEVASNGTDYVVAWNDYRTATRWDAYVARVTAAGVVQDPAGKLVDTYSFDVSIASAGANYLIAYTEQPATDANILARPLVTSTGNLGSIADVAVNATDESDPTVASNGTDYMIVWEDDRTTGNHGDLYAARVTGAGAYVAGSEFVVASGTGYEYAPFLGRFGANYILVSARATFFNGGPSGNAWRIMRIAATGGVTSNDSFGASAVQQPADPNQSGGANVVPASDGTTVMVTFESGYFGGTVAQVVVATYSGSTLTQRSFPASVIANVQTDPAIAFNGSNYLLAWHDQRTPSGLTPVDEIYAVRVGTNGAVLDPSGIDVGAGSLVAVASNGTDFLLGWNGSSTVRLRRLAANGTLLDAAYFNSGVNNPTVGAPSIAWNGANYLVVGEARARRCSSAGTMVDAAAITVGGTDGAVASNGSNYLIAFRTGAAGSYDIAVQRVDTNGVVLDAAPNVVSNATGNQQHPAAASNGTDYVVAWDDARNATTDIYASTVNGSTGAAAANFGVATETGAQINPSVAWNQTDYVFLWDDHRGATSDIYATRLITLPPGVESATVGTLVSADTTLDETAPVVSRGPTDTVLLAYQRPTWPLPYAGASRVYSRSLGYGSGIGAVCNVNTDCGSNNCVDGVCCMTACAGGTTDCMACSIARGAPTDGTCAIVLVGANQVCRPATSACDQADTCIGAATCPADAVKPISTICNASAGACDPAETCDGATKVCPADVLTPMGTTCRGSSGGCDVVETCTGNTPQCPVDDFQPVNTVCRIAMGMCDVAEICSGTDASCPGDSVVGSGMVCRPAADVCDVAESCNGVSPTCPIDGFKGNTSQCDVSHDAQCDFADFCTGTGPSCPEDGLPDGTSCNDMTACTTGDQCQAGVCTGAVANAGTVCRGSAGVCDAVETCDGVTTVCPMDGFMPASIECRASAGPCDSPEFCVGIAAACPGDVRLASGVVCRAASAGGCDLAESCDGVNAACPTNVFQNAGVECRASSGVCDVAETCPGGTDQCPTNAFMADGLSCDDGLTCTQTSSCQVGACAPALTLDCTDGNSCTTDTCVEPTGCQHTVLPICLADAGLDAGNNGGNDAGNDGGDAGTTTPPAKGGCSCHLGASKPSQSGLSLIALFAAAVLVRRARRRA